jgi:hypothetical protein
MSQNIKRNRAMPVCGLGTFTHTISATSAGTFYCSAQATDVPPSGLSIVINQNGSPVATSPSPLNSDAQTVGVDTHMTCAASDVITVVISSSTPNDALLNTVKTMIRLDGGPAN